MAGQPEPHIEPRDRIEQTRAATLSRSPQAAWRPSVPTSRASADDPITSDDRLRAGWSPASGYVDIELRADCAGVRTTTGASEAKACRVEARTSATRQTRAVNATRIAASVLLAAFVGLVAVLHVLEPSLTPYRHVISEYVNSDSGPLMVVALLALSCALLLTARLVAHSQNSTLAAGLLMVAAVAILLAAVFPTQAVGGQIPDGEELRVPGRLHDLGSGLATVSLFAAVAVTAWAERARSVLGRLMVLLLVAAVAVQAGLLAVVPEVGGIRQRLLILIACVAQAVLLHRASSVAIVQGSLGLHSAGAVTDDAT